MALTPCRECGGEVSTEADACPKCGAKVLKPKRTKWWLWIPLGLFAAFMGYGFVLSSTPEGQAKSQARAAIRLCWDSQGSRSNSAGSAQFIAGACEQMERDYRARFNANP
jgi:hypothetical protein